MLERVFVCPKCKGLCLTEDWIEKRGTCKSCSGNKYHARKIPVDGVWFDSQHEANIWQDLQAEERQGLIRNLERQVIYLIEVNGMKICKCILDFRYICKGNDCVEVADAKSKATITPVYRLKKKLMKAIHNIDIIEM